MNKGLKDKLPLSIDETGILVKWNRKNGDMELYIEGPPLHIKSAEVVLKEVKRLLDSIADDKGFCYGKKSIEKEEEHKINEDIPSWLRGK